MVTFRDGNSLLGTAPVDANGQATLTVSLGVGNHTLTASFAGTGNFANSASAAVDVTVNRAATAVALASSANPASTGQAVTFTATVTAVAPGAGTPTGTVTFQDGNVILGTVAVGPGGTATFTTRFAAAGGHAITAAYSGDDNFVGSAQPLTEQVNLSTGLNQRFAAQILTDLLHRPADAASVAALANALGQGISRLQAVRGILASTEFRANEVNALYNQYLHRAADPVGLSFFTNFLGAGGTVEQVAVVLASSDEYAAVRGGGTNDGFIDALFRDALGRPADAASRAALRSLLANGFSRAQAVSLVVSSTEYRVGVVNGFYQQFLRRVPGAGEASFFATALASGSRDEDVIAVLVASDEYLARV
jgi:hypothetical protein